MIDQTGGSAGGSDAVTLMDELLRTGLPEIKLALGDVIDRENVRPLPPRYARLLPPSTLIVVLRADAAEALRPIAPDLERELTDSCNRHGSLYDRAYRVELQRTDQRDAPLYTVTVQTGGEDDERETEAAAASPDLPALPLADPDATRIDLGAPEGWYPHQWLLVVENQGQEREVFRIVEPLVTIGRATEDARLRPAIAISDAPHVSRRQLALRWAERDGAAGFTLYNLGLNAVHLPGQSIPGAGVRAEDVDFDAIPAESTGWVPPGVPLRIGDHGPTLRIEEVPPPPDEDVSVDPDATVFG